MNTNKLRGAPGWLIVLLAALFLASLAYLLYGNYLSGQSTGNLVANGVLLSVPLGLMYFSIGALVTAAMQRSDKGQIGSRLAKIIYWTPRIAGIAITLFVAMFALDVFDIEGSLWEKIGAFLIHAAPAIAMGILLAFAWRRDQVGFVAFLLAAIVFLRFLLPNPLENLSILLLFSGPMAAIALLFWANWKWKKELRPT